MSKAKAKTLIVIIPLIWLAFAIRIYDLGTSPYRGDEAFAVRYWAAPPSETLTHLAAIEPHPFGTFISFWAWKSLVGDSEFAMRMLSVLINLIGVAVIYALALRLFQDQRTAALSALLWSINPYQIWHAQDARNYAMWAALSLLSLWLLIRAGDRNRRLDWILYIIAATVSLYIFFTEAFIVVVHGLYILVFRRRALPYWIISMLVVGILLIPWLIQLWTLTHSGYQGTAKAGDVSFLWVLGVDLAFGEARPDLSNLAVAVFNGFYLLCLIVAFYRDRRAGGLFAMLIVIPVILLMIAGTKINILQPRYLIAITPALLLPVAAFISALMHKRQR